MPVNLSQVRGLTARKIIQALRQDGFYLWEQEGSHQQYRHMDGRAVTVSFHSSGDTFKIKTLKSMMEQARWDESDVRSLGLVG